LLQLLVLTLLAAAVPTACRGVDISCYTATTATAAAAAATVGASQLLLLLALEGVVLSFTPQMMSTGFPLLSHTC
jgi:hypothetical protein